MRLGGLSTHCQIGFKLDALTEVEEGRRNDNYPPFLALNRERKRAEKLRSPISHLFSINYLSASSLLDSLHIIFFPFLLKTRHEKIFFFSLSFSV